MSIGRLGRLPIAARVPLMAAVLMVVLGVVASQQVLLALTRAQEARLRELARLHVDGLSVALGPSVLRQDVWEVFDTLDRASAAGGGLRMVMTAVADDRGRVLAATDPRQARVGGLLAELAGDAQPLDGLTVDAGDARVRVLAPLVYQGRSIGQILTELDVSDLAAERRRAALYLLLGNALATVLIALGGYLAMRHMLRPIATLASHMGEVSGKPTAIPEAEVPKGDPEIARLFRTFNGMVDAVEAKVDAERRLAERERFVSLGRLASSLAHEINNPLGGLLNAADTIRRFADRPDVVRTSAALLERGLKHLRDVARVTLDHNRLASDGVSLKPDDLDDLRLLVSPEIDRQEQRLEWKIAAGAADLAGFPAAKVRQIVLNLLLNASTAAGRGGSVALAVTGDPTGLRISLRDSGPGLPPAALQRLLSSEHSPPGGGVGLRIVRELVSDLGGSIDHRRIDGRTEVVVGLPARQAAEVA